ncbi:flavin reductase family protein [Nocardioides sambongensis]|uniref:flavin reductase family protein n=1 Tax=Nocardioides sambongensis TaxID=2589074 RepID=UPI001127BBE9|nr:flavin reductase [Nocardioides sambongensis]
MTIHSEHPFADPNPDPARRLRGRLGGAVTLWTAGSGATRAGLTVSSLLVALGPSPRLLALLDPDSDLLDELEDAGTGVVQLLSWSDRQLAEVFAGTAPAPGGPFRQAEWVQTEHGPRLASATTWVAVRLVDRREVGWSVEVTVEVEAIEVGEEEPGGDRATLTHRRGRFGRAD